MSTKHAFGLPVPLWAFLLAFHYLAAAIALIWL